MDKGYLYKITHTPTGLMYFGSRKTPEGISVSADAYMGSPVGSNRMRELFDTRPDTEFEKEILTVGLHEDIIELEPLLIQESWDKFGKESEGGLVCNLVAGHGQYVFTDDVRAKMSAAHKGKTLSAEHRAKLSASGKGRTHSAETRAKLSAAHNGKKGVRASAETKAKMSAAHKGKTHGAETRAKMSAAHKWKTLSADHKAKLSAAAKGKPSPNKGKPLSAEHRAKMSAAMKASWAKRREAA